jgi:hypothetical protein
MLAQEPVTRQYRMLCQRCDHTWQGTYVIRTLHDDAGDHELFYRDGAPSIGPAATPPPVLRRPAGPHHSRPRLGVASTHRWPPAGWSTVLRQAGWPAVGPAGAHAARLLG